MRELILAFVVFGGLLLVLGLITAIGHGLWLAAAGLIRLLFGRGGSEQTPLSIRCPRCGRSLARSDRWCAACEWGPASTGDASTALSDLQATARQLERFKRSGAVTDTAYRSVLRAIEAEERRLSIARKPVDSAAVGEPVLLPPAPDVVPVPVTSPVPPVLSGGTVIPTAAAVAPELAPTAATDAPSTAVPLDSAGVAEPPLVQPVFARTAEGPATSRRAASIGQPIQAISEVPRKPLSEILVAFMEQRNIRWGELVGGLLIIGCSIALVISLWSTITSVPILKYFLFTAVISALFGVGLYTEHRWKLPMTSHAVLIIATLLVPLNFLAIAAFSQGMQSWDVQRLASEFVAFGAFFYLTYRSGRIIVPAWPWAITLGVLGPAVAQLVIRRFVNESTGDGLLLGVGVLPLVCYGGSTAVMLRSVRGWERAGESESNSVFVLLGSVSFATALAIGLLVYISGRPIEALRVLAPLLSLCGVPGLACGLILWRRLTDEQLTSFRVAATSIGVAGVLTLLSGIVLAWPRPAVMLPVAFMDFVALTAVAVLFDLPAAHLLAAPCLVFGYLVGLHLVVQRIHWSATAAELMQAIFSATSGNGLVPMVVGLSAIGSLWRRFARPTDARIYQAIAGIVALISLGLVTAFGFGRSGDPYWVTIVYALYAVAAYVGAWKARAWPATVAGALLTLAALVQGIVFKIAGHSEPIYWQLAVLVHATVSTVAAGAVRFRLPDMRRAFADPLGYAGLASSGLAIPFWLYAMPSESSASIATYTLWLALIWLALSFLHRMAGLFTASQFMTAISALLAVSAYVDSTDWYATLTNRYLDPWVLELYGIALSVLCLGWIGLRTGFMRWSLSHDRAAITSESGSRREAMDTIQWLLNPPWPPVDRIVIGLVLVGFVVMLVCGVTPGVMHEMAPRSGTGIVAEEIGGVLQSHVFSGTAWILWLLLIAVLAAGLFEQFTPWLVHGLTLTVACVCPLVAGLWDSELATASALRWLFAGYLVAASIPIWFRRFALDWVARFSGSASGNRMEPLARESRVLLFTIAITPVLALTIYPAVATIFGSAPVGVAATSVFGRMGDSISYVIPLVAVIGVLVGHAMRERSAAMAFAAGLVLNLAVTLGYLLHVVTSAGGSIDTVTLVRLVQLNVIATASFAIAWVVVRIWWLRRIGATDRLVAGPLIRLQVAIAVALNLVLVIPADFWLFVSPGSIRQAIVESGSALGIVGFILAMFAGIWLLAKPSAEAGGGRSADDSNSLANNSGLGTAMRLSPGLTCAFVLGCGSLCAFHMCRWDAGFAESTPFLGFSSASVPWLGYHVLMLSRVVAGWLFLRIAWVKRSQLVSDSETRGLSWQAATERFTAIASLLATVLAVRDAFGGTDPDAPWWSVGTFAALSLLMAAQARSTLRRGYLYWAGILGNLAATSWSIEQLWPRNGHILDTIHVNIIALALPAVAWLALELQVFRRAAIRSYRLPAFHRVAALVALVVLTILVAIGLCADAMGHPIKQSIEPLGWAALASVAAIVVACLWDLEARFAMPSLYLLGLVGIGMVLDRLNLTTGWLGWTGVIALAAYSVATSYVWSIRSGLGSIMDRLGIPRRNESPLGGQAWLLAVNQLVAAAVVVLAFWIVLTFDGQSVGGGAAVAFTLRVTAAKAAISQALAIGLLAVGVRRSQLQKVSLLVVAIGGVAWGWAWLNPLTTGNLLNRAVVVLTVLAAVTVLYGIGLTKILRRENDWTRGAQELMPWLAGLCAVSLVVILSVEVADQVRIGRVEMGGLAIVVVALTLVALAAAGLVLAVIPGRDPFQLSERGRTTYVYAAEGLLGLLFMHIRLTKPEWFGGLFEQFWPLVVLAVAYLGVGLSEVFQRQHRLVLAEPLQRTGSLLPVLPVLGFWAIPSHTHYSLVLITVGLLYGALSVTRKSFGFGVVASVAANGGLMYLLNHNLGFGWFEHAQLWLIPGALCVLAAAYLNREQLSREQFISIRYITVMVIYVASTSDIFLSGVRAAPWLPLVLALLSVAGIMCGIWLRVRAFLFLGTAFLVLSLVTMILSAQVNLGWTWLWWVAGISLGVGIIALFALFEKRRNEMLQMVEGLKQWEG